MLYKFNTISTSSQTQNNLIFQAKGARSKIYKEPNLVCKDLVVFGKVLFTTVNYPFYTQYLRNIVELTPSIRNILVGILISNGSLRIRGNSNNIYIRFRQSITHSTYLFFCYFK
jgi:hypothetical protein